MEARRERQNLECQDALANPPRVRALEQPNRPVSIVRIRHAQSLEPLPKMSNARTSSWRARSPVTPNMRPMSARIYPPASATRSEHVSGIASRSGVPSTSSSSGKFSRISPVCGSRRGTSGVGT